MSKRDRKKAGGEASRRYLIFAVTHLHVPDNFTLSASQFLEVQEAANRAHADAIQTWLQKTIAGGQPCGSAGREGFSILTPALRSH